MLNLSVLKLIERVYIGPGARYYYIGMSALPGDNVIVFREFDTHLALRVGTFGNSVYRVL